MLHETTFRTDGGLQTAGQFELTRVTGLTCRVKKITCSDEGKLTLAIEATASNHEALEQVRDLILIQQGDVTMTLEGTITEIPGENLTETRQ